MFRGAFGRLAKELGCIIGINVSGSSTFFLRHFNGINFKNPRPKAAQNFRIIVRIMIKTIRHATPNIPYLIYDTHPVKSHILFFDCTSITKFERDSLFDSCTLLSNLEKTLSCSRLWVSNALCCLGAKSSSLEGKFVNFCTIFNLLK